MVSIIVPVFNKSKYLASMIESLLSQSFRDFEVIFVDDGSTDGSETIIKSYLADDDRIVLVSSDNNGVSHARNIGLEQARGKYIAFIDADDRVASNYLESLVRALEENDVEFVISRVRKVNAQGDVLQVMAAPYEGIIRLENILTDFVKIQNKTGIYGTCGGKLFRRSLCDDVRFDETIKLAEDFDFFIKLYRKIDTIFFEDNELYYYLQNADNSTASLRDDQLDYLAQVKIQISLKHFLEDHNSYSGTNKNSVQKSVSDYIYYTLHYANEKKFVGIFNELQAITKGEGIRMRGGKLRQKWILFLYQKQSCFLIRASVNWFWRIKHVIQGIKG